MRSRLRLPRAMSSRVASAILLVLLAAVVFVNSWGVFQTDIKPEVYLAPQETLPRYLAAWTSSPYLGSPNFNVGLVPVLIVTGALRAIGLDAEMAFKVYHLLLWGLAAWGANRLLRALVPSASVWAGLLAGVAYIANPYAVAAGGTLAIALPMALLPWMLIAMTKALRDPSGWAWPAAVGLIFFAMSGMNVGVVPVYQLLLVIPLALCVRAEQDLRWRQVAAVLAKSALFVIAVSLYWLAPGAAASSTGSQIAEGSESLDGIARTSSFVEVLRGLGLWSYYGSSDAGPWIPQYAVYFTSGVVILFTMLWPTAALLSLKVVPARLARFAATGAAMVAVIMIGLYPGGNGSSPFAMALRWLFEHVGPLIAFRTTNKIGAGLALVFALVIGWAIVRTLPRLTARPGAAPLLGGLGVATAVALVAPAVTGNLYVSPLDVPDYWEEAANAVDQGDPNQRVLLLPGQTRSDYRWSMERPDDLPNSLFHRDTVIPESIPNTSDSGANFLAALDDTLQSGVGGDRNISPFARYLGVDHVLLRHDVVWEKTGGGRPALTADALSTDKGLQGLANFGESGHNMFTPAAPPISQAEAVLSPLQLYGVKESRAMVRATPLPGSVVVAGDAWSIPVLSREGLIEGSPAIRYAHDLSEDEFERLLDEDGRMVLTDTNQRRAAIINRLTSSQGAVLAADETPKITRTLGDDPRDQSTLVREGVQVSASSSGGAFFDLPHGVAENAIDGDPSTSWLFGDFQRAVGESVSLRLPESRELGVITITTTALGDVQIDSLEVRTGDSHQAVEVDEDGTATLDLDGVSTDEVDLRVESTRGSGFSLVGIAEIDLGDDDLRAGRTIRTPDTLSRLYGTLPTRERATFAEMPLDVSFTRVQNTDALDDDTEQDLRRNFTTPDDRVFDSTARVRFDGPLEPLADELAGLDTAYRARSNQTYFDSLTRRASGAADGSADTAWVPGGDVAKAWWELSGPRRSVKDVTITQRPGPGDERDTAWATRATVLVDGEEVAKGALARGSSTIDVPRGTSGRTVRIRIDEIDDSAGDRPARFTEIDTGTTIPKGAVGKTCVTVATIDGTPMKMRPKDPEAIAGPQGPATTWIGCGEQSVVWGEHELRPVEDVQLDGLMLRDVQGADVTDPVPPPVVEVERRTMSSSMTVDVGAANAPYFLSIGQGYDDRWTATLEDGSDLGAPVIVNGYATGWYVDDLAAHTVEIGYGPQTRANIALALSGLGLLLATLVFLAPMVRRRRAELRAQRESEWEAAESVRSESTEPAEGVDTVAEATDGSDQVPVAAVSPALEDEPSAPAEPADETRRPRVYAGLTRLLDARTGRRRVLIEAATVLGTAAIAGLGGGIGALIALLLVRRGRTSAGRIISLGAVLVALSAVAFVIHAAFVTDTLGTVSADAIKTALVPHHLAGAGLALAVIGTFLRHDTLEEIDP